MPLGPPRSPGEEAPSVGCGKAPWWTPREGLLQQDTGSSLSPRSLDFCDCHLLEGDSVVPSITGSPAGRPSWLCKGAWMVAMMPQSGVVRSLRVCVSWAQCLMTQPQFHSFGRTGLLIAAFRFFMVGRMTDMSAGWRGQLLRFLTTVAGLSLLDNSCTVGVTEAVPSPKQGRVPPK